MGTHPWLLWLSWALTRGACENRVRVPRRLAEDIILGSVRERLLDPDRPFATCSGVSRTRPGVYKPKSVGDLFVSRRSSELKDAKKRQANLVAFVAEGAGDRGCWPRPWPRMSRRSSVSRSRSPAFGVRSDKVIPAPSMRWIRQRLLPGCVPFCADPRASTNPNSAHTRRPTAARLFSASCATIRSRRACDSGARRVCSIWF